MQQIITSNLVSLSTTDKEEMQMLSLIKTLYPNRKKIHHDLRAEKSFHSLLNEDP